MARDSRPKRVTNCPSGLRTVGREMGAKMKIIPFAALAFAIGSSASQADELSASQGARYAAMSLVDGQGARAIVSNVLVPANGAHLAPCQVQVSFVGADGSMIGKATMVQLKAGESTSVSASNPSKLVRAIVSIGDVVDPAKICALRTSVEIFDVQTGTTLVSVPGESIGRENSVATTSSLSGVTVSRKKTRSPILAAPPTTR